MFTSEEKTEDWFTRDEPALIETPRMSIASKQTRSPCKGHRVFICN